MTCWLSGERSLPFGLLVKTFLLVYTKLFELEGNQEFPDQDCRLCNVTVTAISLNRYKRNWSIACDLSESSLVLCGAFLFLLGIFIHVV